jgi:cell division transport system permease protein
MKHHGYYAFIRVVKSGFLNLFRNLWLTIAATAVMLVALTIILIGIVLNVTTSNAIDVLSRELKTSIFLAEDVSQTDRIRLEEELRRLDFVETVEYISPKQAQERLTRDPSIGADVLQATALFEGSTFLSPSLELGLNDLSRAQELAAFDENPEFETIISRVALGRTDTGRQTDAEKAIERAAATERFITIGSIIAASTLAAVSIMIIFNTIRMAIYTRRDEIAIMKLIGATPNYIRGPFLVEASLYGVIAGVLAVSVVYTLIFTLGARVSDAREFSQTYAFFTDSWMIILLTLGTITTGILIGIVSSMLAMERHLKLKHW